MLEQGVGRPRRRPPSETLFALRSPLLHDDRFPFVLTPWDLAVLTDGSITRLIF